MHHIINQLFIKTYVGKIYPFEIFIEKVENGIGNDSKIKVNQIRTIDKSRLKNKIDMLSDSKIYEVENAIKIHLGIK